jgi:predicted phosphodiesterase
MKFRVVSDLHLEFRHNYLESYVLPPLPDDKETVLILAGDIGLLADPRTYSTFMKHSSEQFKYIFWIGGNHEWYHGNIDDHSVKMAIDDLALPNLFTDRLVLENEKIVIVGDTLWTDFENGDPSSMFISKRGMSDFQVIEVGDGRTTLHPARVMMMHQEQKDRILRGGDYYAKHGFKVIAVSHHQPSLQGIAKEYLGDPMNGAFASNLDEEIKSHKIEYWIAGHTHTSIRYSIGETKCICNPLGYPFEKNSGFDPLLTIEL